jgi:hypothetical protein
MGEEGDDRLMVFLPLRTLRSNCRLRSLSVKEGMKILVEGRPRSSNTHIIYLRSLFLFCPRPFLPFVYPSSIQFSENFDRISRKTDETMHDTLQVNEFQLQLFLPQFLIHPETTITTTTTMMMINLFLPLHLENHLNQN